MIDITITISALNELRRLYAAGSAIVGEETRRAMEESVVLAEEEIVALTPVDTGRLRQGVFSTVEGGGTDLTGRVGVLNVPYAGFVELGTEPHEIVPRRGRALRFRAGRGGPFIFRRRVRHPGTRAVHFFRDGAGRAEPRIRERFEAALSRVRARMATR